jgi:hypothetical protein
MADELRRAHQRANINTAYMQKNELLALEGRKLVYDNQKEAALKIMEHYQNGKLAVILVAQPGAGKTGVIVELQYLLGTHNNDDCFVFAENFHTISGMSDCEWKLQTQRNILEIPKLRENVRHRGEIQGSMDKFRTLERGIMAADECHVAAGKSMTLSKMLKEADLLNVGLLQVKGNRLLEISATPEAVMTDLATWGDKAAVVFLKPDAKYKGFQTMLDEQRIRNAVPITNNDLAIQLLRLIEERFVATSKKFFVIRTEDMESIGFLKTAAHILSWDVKHHDSKDKITNADELMKAAPPKHTIIFIKGFWRASKRIIRDNVGATYEQSPKKRNTTATSQGLTARFCDTFEYSGSWLDPNLRPLHYCDMGAIEEYMEWVQGGCDYRNSDYHAGRMKSKGGRVNAKATKVHHTNVEGLVPHLDGRDFNISPYSVSPTFATRDEAHAWIMPRINWDGVWNPTKSSVINVNPCSQDGSPGSTHIRTRGVSIEIPTEATFRASNDYSRFGAGVRCARASRPDQPCEFRKR